MTDTDETALLNAVLARPLDDTPRLVLADWLDDHADSGGRCGACDGHGLLDEDGRGFSEGTTCEACRGFGGRRENGAAARAEFVRVQVELARHPGMNCGSLYCSRRGPEGLCDDCARFVELRRRERELFGSHAAGWFEMGFPHRITCGDTAERTAVPLVVVRRGFVDEITAPALTTLFGGPCGRCEGRGFATRPTGTGDSDCPDCSGTGTTPGIAAAVFRQHPVTRVVVANREPTQNVGNRCWMWVRESGMAGMRDELPSEVFDHLQPADPLCPYHVFGRPGDWRSYPTRDAALDALSRACVDAGRRRAGLGPLTAPGSTG